MGIQVVVTNAALSAAGVEVEYQSSPIFDEDAQVVGETRTARLTFPSGEVVNMNAHGDDVWADFNHWGTNRPILEPLLKGLQIPYREV